MAQPFDIAEVNVVDGGVGQGKDPVTGSVMSLVDELDASYERTVE